jgi:hypothetical protein
VAGIWVQTLPGITTNISNGTVWACSKVGIQHISGNVTVNGTLIQNSAVGIGISTATGQSNRIGVHFDNVGQPVLAMVATDNVYGTGDISNRGPGGSIIADNGNVICETLASAAAIGLPMNGQVFNVTGTTNFGTLGPGWKDREVTLIFAGVLTVFTGTGANTSMLLSGNQNFTTTAGATLTLRHNGVQWYEIGRSGGQTLSATVASADPLPIAAQGEIVNVTGTTNFGTIAGGADGRQVTLIFGGALTVFTGTATSGSVRLSGAVNFSPTAGGTLTIRHNGVQWYEIGRSA